MGWGITTREGVRPPIMFRNLIIHTKDTYSRGSYRHPRLFAMPPSPDLSTSKVFSLGKVYKGGMVHHLKVGESGCSLVLYVQFPYC